MREAIEAGEGGAVRRDVRASNFREAEQLVSPVDFMELTPAQIRTFFSSMLYYLKRRPDLPYAQLTCEVSTADGADCAEECGADEIPRDFQAVTKASMRCRARSCSWSMLLSELAVADWAAPAGAKVRKAAKLAQKVGPTYAFYSCIPTGMHGPTCIFWANLTPFSRKVQYVHDTQDAMLKLGETAAGAAGAAATQAFYREMLRRDQKRGGAMTVDVPKAAMEELSRSLFRPFASILRMEWGLSDVQYSRFGKLFVELAGPLSEEAKEVIRLFAGKTGSDQQPFEALYLAKAREDRAVPGLTTAIMNSKNCGGTTWFARGPGAIIGAGLPLRFWFSPVNLLSMTLAYERAG